MYDFGPSAAPTEDLLFEAYGFNPLLIEGPDYVWLYDPKTGIYYTDEPNPTKTRDLLTVMYSHPVQNRLIDWAENIVKSFLQRQIDPKGWLNIGYIVPRYFKKKDPDLIVDRGNVFTISFQVPFSLEKSHKKQVRDAWRQGEDEPRQELFQYLMAAFERMVGLGLYNDMTFGGGRGAEQSAQQLMSGQQTVVNAMMDLDIPKDVLKGRDWKKIKRRLVPADVRKVRR